MLADICKRENIRCVVHAHYVDTYSSSRTDLENTLKMKHRILEILDFCGDCFLWEDTIGGLFSYANPHLLPHLVKPLNLPLNVDISHAFISFGGDNDRLEETLRLTRPYARYYHVVDSCGEHHDSLPLGKGKIDWRRVIPYVEDRPFIFEITLPGDHTDCTLMIESARTFTEIRNSLHHSRL